jgi:hypothetical protein
MNLEEIRDAIASDLKIDRFNLVDEASRTPQLFSKYLSIYMEEKMKLRKLKRKSYELYVDRREFYLGHKTHDKYVEEPWDKTVLRQDVSIYLDADSKVQDLNDRIVFQEAIVDMLERTLKEINNRNYTIKSMIDVIRFESGA